jgi:hypothetical protein
MPSTAASPFSIRLAILDFAFTKSSSASTLELGIIEGAKISCSASIISELMFSASYSFSSTVFLIL